MLDRVTITGADDDTPIAESPHAVYSIGPGGIDPLCDAAEKRLGAKGRGCR